MSPKTLLAAALWAAPAVVWAGRVGSGQHPEPDPQAPAQEDWPKEEMSCEYNPPMPDPLTGAAVRDLSRVQITPNYSLPDWAAQKGWSYQDDYAACGLVAAETLMRYYRKDPGLDSIQDLKSTGLRTVDSRGLRLWTASTGMCDPDCEKELLAAYGVPADAIDVGGWDLGSIAGRIKANLDAGMPVIVSTGRHYFVAQGYNGDSFFVGHTGEAMRYWGKADDNWTIGQINYFGYDPRAGGISRLFLLHDPDEGRHLKVCHKQF